MAGKEKKPDKEPGYVYILTNPSFREDWVKIGKSSRPVNVRSKELDNTAVPLPFEIYATLRTVKYEIAEKKLHKLIDRFTQLRIRKNREFFNIPPETALEQLKDVADLLEDGVVTLYKNNQPITLPDDPPSPTPTDVHTHTTQDHDTDTDDPHHKRSRFRFSMIGLKAGDAVTFAPTGERVSVVSDNEIERGGQRYKLSQFCRLFMPEERRTPTNTYQGAKFFTHNGQTLDQLRTEKEREEGTDNTDTPTPTPSTPAEPLDSGGKESKEATDSQPTPPRTTRRRHRPADTAEKSGLDTPTLDPTNASTNSADDTQTSTNEPRYKRSRFRFSMIGLKAGDAVTFAPTGERVSVVSDNEIERGGQRYKLSQFCRLFMPEERRTPTNAYQGACFFTHNGQTLEKLRRSMDKAAAADKGNAPSDHTV